MSEKHMFSNRDLFKLLLPLIVEQLLNSLMGTVDTIMVSNVGSEAISAVSLVDSVCILVMQVFNALAAGGVIVCAQYIGKGDIKTANRAANQLILTVTVISLCLSAGCLLFGRPLLGLIFGSVEEGVMSAARTYFFYMALSFPFIALFNASSSIFRAQKNTRTPMLVSIISNGINVAANALFIWGLGLGVAGAALATLLSRVFCALVTMWYLRKQDNMICVRNYRSIRPDFSLIKRVLAIGIPSGVENGMFQFGKLAIQSTVSTMGTVAIAAQAVASIMENVNGVAGCGVGIGLMTVVGQCIGAGRKDEARYYIKKLTLIAEAVIIFSCIFSFLITRPVTMLGGMEKESAELCVYMVGWITIVKPVSWTLSFIPAYGMRAAGDVKFSMIVSCVTMWLCRVSLCIYLSRVWEIGPMAVWIGMFADWTVRGLIFTARFYSGRWAEHRVVQ
ncbi:MAG: MATE family efflux transporter [Lachnospiraceae bacterium]|nr:MATE family efflux transporter [Lachnospiraceae bacterium]